MPANYAHRRFGREVLKSLEGALKSKIEKYPDLYQVGLHGPDILFFYKPLKKNPVSLLGERIHQEPGRIFFENAKTIIKNSKEKDASFSYIFGVLNHFILDATSHGYVEEKEEQSGISHAEIESEFDRFLLLKDDKDPRTFDINSHIKISENLAKHIAPFYGITTLEILKSIEGMIRVGKIIRPENQLKVSIVHSLMKLFGIYHGYKGLVINIKGNQNCNDSNEMLFGLYNSALETASTYIKNLELFIKDEKELCPFFDTNFNGRNL